jgi:hypothetical protein
MAAAAQPSDAVVSVSGAHKPGEPQAMTQKRIDAAKDAYNGVPAQLEFVTMSDPELSGSATATKSAEDVAYAAAAPHFRKISQWAEGKDFELQAVIVNGDVVGANGPEYAAHQGAIRRLPAGTGLSNA